MPNVNVEVYFPFSRAVENEANGRVSLAEEILPNDTVGSLLARLAERYIGLRQQVFDPDKQLLNPMVLVIVNRGLLKPDCELLETRVNDGDEVSILPQAIGG